MTVKVNFDFQKREELRDVYDKAVREKKKSFMFQGNEILVSYAKYLLQYLDMTVRS